ncbi:MAG TPA: twin-arginine translocase TatA/TatE family subunit [Solirubrobacteraceae bacterium]|nr:twin-arginine translocase TatA/TatE family subunit [Solirubrobacteraceae bacterium]
MGLDNPLHIAFLLIVLLLVFGAKRLPEIGRSIGTGMREFKDSISGISSSETTPVLMHPQQPQVPAQPLAAQAPVMQQAPAQQAPVQQPPAQQPPAQPPPVQQQPVTVPAPAQPAASAPAEAPVEPAQQR